jgi:HPt (histidine-containing phosphotransfer) domain-containing protein
MAKTTALGAEQNAPQDRAHGPIDMEHLGRQALGDPGLQDEVLRLYARMSQEYLSRIEESTSIPMLLEHLHTLKSAAAGIGAWGVRDLAKLAEDELRSGQPANPERIEDIAVAVIECVAFIDGMVEPEELPEASRQSL